MKIVSWIGDHAMLTFFTAIIIFLAYKFIEWYYTKGGKPKLDRAIKAFKEKDVPSDISIHNRNI